VSEFVWGAREAEAWGEGVSAPTRRAAGRGTTLSRARLASGVRTVHPVTDCLLGPALGLLVLVGSLACSQLLDGQALLSGLADTRSSRVFGDPGLVEQALPVMARAFFSRARAAVSRCR